VKLLKLSDKIIEKKMANYIEEILKLYKEKNLVYGEGDPQNLWRRVESQTRRFDKFLDLFSFEGKSILDVGCGYGDFYSYLINKNISPHSYVGCDIMPEHCKVAVGRLPKECTILEGDFLEINASSANIVVLSGTLNTEFDNWLDVSKKILDKMWNLATDGMVFNMQSSHGLQGEYGQKVLNSRNISPEYWVQYAHEKTCKYGLYHDYMHYDYTIAMWKVSRGWQENNG
jgi:SAM-dependent methyltransferase